LKSNFFKKKKLQKGYEYRAYIATHSIDNSSSSDVVNFSTNLAAFLNDFATYLKEKGDTSLTASSNFDFMTLTMVSLMVSTKLYSSIIREF
jgi:hypothetical protein